VDHLLFPALQTYGDGTESAWIQAPKTDGSEPDMPAPILRLTPVSAGGSASAEDAGKHKTNNGVAIAALVVGTLALALAGFNFLRGRRTTT
jgi:uncharacterized protein HemX